MSKSAGRIKAVGEIALRVENLDAMHAFYEDVIGLPLLKRFEDSAFFRVAEGFGGHVQVLALFDRSACPGYAGLESSKTTLDHFAFEISLDDFEDERRRLESHGLDVRLDQHAWVKWRSLYVTDPEGNVVEFVCYDESITV